MAAATQVSESSCCPIDQNRVIFTVDSVLMRFLPLEGSVDKRKFLKAWLSELFQMHAMLPAALSWEF